MIAMLKGAADRATSLLTQLVPGRGHDGGFVPTWLDVTASRALKHYFLPRPTVMQPSFPLG